MDVIGSKLAPIVLFVYNRPAHTKQTLEALEKNILANQSTLYIIADGPKENATELELVEIEKTRLVIKEKQWCKSVTIQEEDTNWGLANSIVSGITKILNEHKKIIVLEDDIVPEIGFLSYMNQALEVYKDNENVMHVSAYIYPHAVKTKDSTLFLKILSCWGWATWDRAWSFYNGDTDEHLMNFKSIKGIKKFNIEGHANYYDQLVANKNGNINSWAVKWYASWLSKGGFSLFPEKSLVKNVGFDGTGVHKDNTSIYHAETTKFIKINKIAITEDLSVRKSIDMFYKRVQKTYLNPVSRAQKIKRIIKTIALKPTRKILLSIFPEVKALIENNSKIINADISTTAKVYKGCSIRNCTIEDYSYISQNANINNTKIGKFCSIGPNLMCGWGIHPTNAISTSPMFYSTKKQNGTTLANFNKIHETQSIQIGHDVFIGMNVTILDGIKIGNGAVIGAGAVVSKDIPPYAIAVGNPIQIKKYRFNKEVINKLENLQWWNWPLEKLKDIEKMIFDIEQFINKNSK